MEQIVTHIFEVLGGATRIAEGTGFPVQTVHCWVNNKPVNIPHWRRSAVLALAEEKGVADQLGAAAVEYLRSRSRAARAAA